MIIFKGLQLALGRFAGVANDIITPKIAEEYGSQNAVFASIFVCFVSFFGALMLYKIDERYASDY